MILKKKLVNKKKKFKILKNKFYEISTKNKTHCREDSLFPHILAGTALRSFMNSAKNLFARLSPIIGKVCALSIGYKKI